MFGAVAVYFAVGVKRKPDDDRRLSNIYSAAQQKYPVSRLLSKAHSFFNFFASQVFFSAIVFWQRAFDFNPVFQFREPEIREIPQAIEVVSLFLEFPHYAERIEEHRPACFHAAAEAIAFVECLNRLEHGHLLFRHVTLARIARHRLDCCPFVPSAGRCVKPTIQAKLGQRKWYSRVRATGSAAEESQRWRSRISGSASLERRRFLPRARQIPDRSGRCC